MMRHFAAMPLRLILCVSIGAGYFHATLRAGGDTLEKLQPVLRAEPSTEGLITWWLVSPPSMHAPNLAAPPLNARERPRDKDTAGWALDIADNFYNSFQAYLKDGAKGSLYASARIQSTAGGARTLYCKTYCATKAWLDGQLVLDKPRPERLAEFDAAITLPKGISELTLELVPRGDQCLIQCALFDTKNNGGQARAAAGDSLVFPMGGAANVTAELLQRHVHRSVALIPKDPFVKAGANTALAAFLPGSVPADVGELGVRLATPGAQTQVLVPNVKRTFDVNLPVEPRDMYEVKIELLSNGKPLATKTITLPCLDGFAKETAELARDLAARMSKTGRAFPNTQLAIEKLNLFIETEMNGGDARNPTPVDEMKEIAENARHYIEIEAKGEDPFAGRAGYMERSYVSKIDNGVQPYLLSVPEKAVEKTTQEFPLVVFLHGYDPNINKHRWWEAKEFAAICARHDAFMTIPFGRSNTDFQSCGEVDMLDVIAELKKLYRIDPQRIYLYGYSMGGMGVYTLASHNADLFAAGIVLAGRANNPLLNYGAIENFHPFKQFLIHADNPISLCENLINFPMRIYHGNDDPVVPKTEALRMNARFKALKADAKLILKPGGHTFGFEVLEEDEPLEWLLTNRLAAAPARQALKTYSLAYAKRGGVEVTSTTGVLEPIELEWNVNAGKREFKKESPNILKKSIDGDPPPLADFKLQKVRALCGPVRQAICTPFMIVYGTKGAAPINAFNKTNAERFADWWFAFTRSKAHIKADTDVTAEDKHVYNLFLFGEQQDNALHAEAAGSLPIEIKNGNVKIGAKVTPLAGKGIMYIYPSPFAANENPRAVVICAGLQYGEKIGANHRLDLIPDFLLYAPEPDADGTNTNKPICAGFFDGAWKLSDKNMWWFDK